MALLLSSFPSKGASFKSLVLHQILIDDVDGNDGLGNPRNLAVLSDNSKVFIASGDDNAFAVFNADENFTLTFSHIFKNSDVDITGLEGASAIALYGQEKHVAVSGFYDGALALFSKVKGDYKYQKTISDGLGYDRVFDSDLPVGKLDKLALLGAWDVISTRDEKQLLTASYMSNAVSVFTVLPNKQLKFIQAIHSAAPLSDSLGKPISLALSPANDELYVLGFDQHQVTIFNRTPAGRLSVKQVLTNEMQGFEHLLNPQKVVVSPNGKSLYIACAGSNALIVLNKNEDGQFTFSQAITNKDIAGLGLEGASSLALTPDGATLFAAGESGNGVHIFEVANNGKLDLLDKISTIGEHSLAKIASLTLTPDSQYLLVATGKNNSLVVFNVITHTN